MAAPEDQMNRIEEKLDKLIEKHGETRERLVKIETRGAIVSGAISTAVGGGVAFLVAKLKGQN